MEGWSNEEEMDGGMEGWRDEKEKKKGRGFHGLA